MNIGSFLYDFKSLYGVFANGMVRPASPKLIAQYSTLYDLIFAGDVDYLRDKTLLSAPIPIENIKFLEPILNSGKVICIGLNYSKLHPVDGVVPPNPENMILFGKERDTLVAHKDVLKIPCDEPALSFDYEGEIAVVIGKPARNVTRKEALDYVLGYTAFNDGSVREWQKHSIYAGKNFANSSAWGPWITTTDALRSIEELHLSVALNGNVVQSAYGSEMIFSVAEQISYISSLFCLQPGDIIATGSPDGTGASKTPKRFLKIGDCLSITVSGIGTLENACT